jgi:hypothetical protein
MAIKTNPKFKYWIVPAREGAIYDLCEHDIPEGEKCCYRPATRRLLCWSCTKKVGWNPRASRAWLEMVDERSGALDRDVRRKAGGGANP